MKIFALVFLVLTAATAYSLELDLGLAIVEEGDDRLKPAASFHLEAHDYQGGFYFFGRNFGPVKEQSVLVSLCRIVPLPTLKSVKAAMGLALMNEFSRVRYSDPEAKAFDSQASQFNAGLALGVYWSSEPLAGVTARLGWESHLFPAGLLGGLFLATGRKQFLSLAAGVDI